MKKYFFLIAIIVCLLYSNFCCDTKKQPITNALISVDSIYVLSNVRLTKRVSKFQDTTICTTRSTDSQILSIEIRNQRLFQTFRDSLGFQSDRLIGLQIFGYQCANCHKFKDDELIQSKDLKNLNLVLSNSYHKVTSMDTLNFDEIHFIRSYLNSLK